VLGNVGESLAEDHRMPHRRFVITTLSVVAALFSGVLLTGCAASNPVDGAVEAATAPPRTEPATTSTTTSTSTVAPTTTTTTVPAVTSTTVPLPANLVLVPLLVHPLVAVGRGDGPETARVQERLIQLGFWLDQVDGIHGHVTRQAIMAFQKYSGIAASGEVDEATAAALSAATERARGVAEAGHLVEVDKSRQLLFLVKDGHTLWALNASTGTEIPYEVENKNEPGKMERGDSITPAGWFATDRERDEGWWEGDLGEIYRPKYFRGGVAVHGSLSIPNFPASHGCVRVSVAAMDMIWASGLVPLKTPVWVHGDIPAQAL